MKRQAHVGISGWSYYDWKGVFYPQELKPRDWLQFYARSFKTAELNASFYRLPQPKTVANWLEKVPADFKLCPKMSKYLTHIKKLKEPEEPLQRFFDVFAPVKAHLGPILIQLPPSLKFDEVLVKDFLDVLKGGYGKYRFALEARNDSWLDDKAYGLLYDHNVAWVISQSGVGFPYAEKVTAKDVYVRFHGPGKLYASLYPDEMMHYYAELFNRWMKGGHRVWAYFNNCYYGYAIDNARTLMSFISG